MYKLLTCFLFSAVISVSINAQDSLTSKRVSLSELNAQYHSTKLTESVMLTRMPNCMPTAFFCKIEHELDKKSKIPIRVRLGDLKTTDALEGK